MGDDGIARSYVIPHVHIGIEEAKENSIAVNSLYKGEKYPLLVNITEIHSITKEAREFFAVRDRETNITCFAIVTKSEVGKMIANFFFIFNRTGVPARMFTDEKKAIAWLNKQRS